MRYTATILFSSILLFSCHSIREKAGEAVGKTSNAVGEAVGKTSSEFAKGVVKGVTSTLDCELTIDSSLQKQGIAIGKFYIESDTNATDNKLSVYIIFNKDFTKTISVKVFDPNGSEYGRTSAAVSGKTGEAKYADFTFDKRTNIEHKSKLAME